MSCSSPNSEEILVQVRITCGKTSPKDFHLYLLRKSTGFKKEEMFKDNFPWELRLIGTHAFDNVMNRMLYMSISSLSGNPVIKSIQLECNGTVNLAENKLNVTYVLQFKKWKDLAADQTGNVLVVDPYKSKVQIYQIVSEIH
jgi:hypothetical protein